MLAHACTHSWDHTIQTEKYIWKVIELKETEIDFINYSVVLQILEKHEFYKIKLVRWDDNIINRFEMETELRQAEI